MRLPQLVWLLIKSWQINVRLPHPAGMAMYQILAGKYEITHAGMALNQIRAGKCEITHAGMALNQI